MTCATAAPAFRTCIRWCVGISARENTPAASQATKGSGAGAAVLAGDACVAASGDEDGNILICDLTKK